MFAVTIVILSLCSVVFSDKCENVKCPVVPKHYEELGCKPIFQQGYCCPLRFVDKEFLLKFWLLSTKKKEDFY